MTQQTPALGYTLLAEPGTPQITITHRYRAPRELVFEALTEARHIPNWWGPRYLTTVVDALDLRPGGGWRFVQTAPDGGVHAFHGYYHQVEAPARLVYTFEYEGVPGHVALETIELEEVDGVTILTDTGVCQSTADRDAMIASGMESGLRDSVERMGELLAEQLRG